MITTELMTQSMDYAESNFLHDNARHLKVDKTFIREHFDLNGKLVLDFGCGMGGMSLWYAKNWSCRVHGMDIDGFHIDVANALKVKHGLENVTFVKRDILEEPLTGRYDYIFMNDVAEHIPYPALQAILNQLANSLTPGGRIFISYPPWEGPYASHVTRVTKLPWCQYLPEKYLMKWIERENMQLTGEHESDLVSAYKGLNHLTHWRLSQLTERAGLQMETRLSHSLLRKIPVFRNQTPDIFPLRYLISKEIAVFKSTKS
jgi:2-polyprenyl-3-methyl-5-hydroxy-6-metoxy-1,4-benzoquinol methylase